MKKGYFKELIQRIKRTNLEVFDTDEKLDYRIVHRERLEKAEKDEWPLD